MAHELGHNWNACHCDNPDCLPPSQGDCDIMQSNIPLNPDLYFGVASKAQITGWRDSRGSCLESGVIYVDWSASAPFWGTALHPWRNVTEGILSAPIDGRVRIRGPHRYFENITTGGRMTIEAINGPVTIGN